MQIAQLRTKSQIAAMCMYAIDAATEQTDGFFDLNFDGRNDLIEHIESLHPDEQLVLASYLLEHCKSFTGTLTISITLPQEQSRLQA